MIRPSVAMTKAGKLAQAAKASVTSLSGRQEGPGPRVAESEPSGLRQVRRSRPMPVQPMQRLVALDERRFLQVCRQLSVTRGGGPR